MALEQATDSLMESYCKFQELLAHIPIYRVRECLGYFGAASAKPIYVYSTVPWFQNCLWWYRAQSWLPEGPGDVVVTYVRDDGRRCVDGGPGLKVTQSYPMEFGHGVAAVYRENWRMHPGVAPIPGDGIVNCDNVMAMGRGPLFDDADLCSAIAILHHLAGRA